MEDDEDRVVRKTMHATSASALQAQAATAATQVASSLAGLEAIFPSFEYQLTH